MSQDSNSTVHITNGVLTSITPAQWTCKRCTLLNGDHQHQCQVCLSPRHIRIPTVSDVEADGDHSGGTNPTCSNGKIESLVKTTDRKEDNPTIAPSTSAFVKTGQDKSKLKTPITNPSVINTGDNSNEDKEWKCRACTFSCNPSWADRCERCGNENPRRQRRDNIHEAQPASLPQSQISASSSASNAMSWNCSKCTFQNSINFMFCSMCGQEKPIAVSGVWHCKHCTLTNLPTDTACSACLKPRYLASNGMLNKTQPGLGPCPSLPNGVGSRATTASSSQHGQSVQSLKKDSSLAEDILLVEEAEAKSLRSTIVQHCRREGDLFVDDQFPPTQKSLFLDPKKPFCSQSIVWRRPQQIISRDEISLPWVVYRTPMPEDISQGTLGNCWLLSALAVLAERRHLVEHLILTDTISREGVYQVRLCKDGLWKIVLIDDLLPCYTSCALIFSKARRKQLWVPLIEKAMAKLHGSYEALVAGKCIEGLSTLTGFPCESIALQGDGSRGEETCPDVIWAKLLSCRDLKFLMGASCGSQHANIEDFHKMGLRARHAYSILDVQDLEGNKLIQLRNPWAHFSWNGKWSDGSPAWQQVSSEGRQRLLAMGEEDGVFWMEFPDLMRYFDSVDVCKIRPDWYEYRLANNFPGSGLHPAQAIRLTVSHTTDVDICLFQQSFRGESAQCQPIDLCVAVLCETRSPTQQTSVGRLVTHTPRQLHSCVNCNFMFNPGEYLIVPFSLGQWNSGMDASESRQPSYVLAVHSSRQVSIQENICDRQYLWADTIIQLAVAKGSREQLRPGVVAYTLMNGWAGSIFVVENVLPDMAVHVRCDCVQSSNVVSTRGTLETVDVVPSYHRQIIMILSHLERSQPYHVSRRLIYRTVRGYQSLMDWSFTVPGSQGLYGDSRHAFHCPEISPHTAALHAPRVIVM